MHGGGLTIKSLSLCSASLNLLCNYWFRSQPETSLMLIHKNRISLSPPLPSGNYTSRSSHDCLDFFSWFSWAKRQNHFYQNGSCLCCPVSGNNWVPSLGAKLWRRKHSTKLMPRHATSLNCKSPPQFVYLYFYIRILK